MSLIDSLVSGGVKGLFEGVGSLAKDIRSAITGDISPEKKAEIEQKLLELEFTSMKAQTDINLEEAKHPNIFVSGWRPFIGWICGISIGAYYIPISLMWAIVWITSCIRAGWVMQPIIPPFSISELIGLVLSLLGLGGMRTYEKLKDAEKNR